MYSKCDLKREGNVKFIEDCKKQGISEQLAIDTIGVLTYNGIAIFKYDLDDMISNYYLIGESIPNEPNIKLCCSSNQLYKIVEYAMDEVVSEIEFELKENYILGSEEPNVLNYCGKYLLSMYVASIFIICDDDVTSDLKEDYISNISRKHIYYKNMIKIALADYSEDI